MRYFIHSINLWSIHDVIINVTSTNNHWFEGHSLVSRLIGEGIPGCETYAKVKRWSCANYAFPVFSLMCNGLETLPEISGNQCFSYHFHSHS